MKKIARRLLSVLASAALFTTYVLPVGVAASTGGHAHHADDKAITPPSDGFTITLTKPDDITIDDFSGNKYGAYQIFSGSVPESGSADAPLPDDLTDPGTKGKSLPITDIKWGNAFGIEGQEGADGVKATDVTIHTRILSFIYELATAKTEAEYSYAFTDFDGFESLVTKDTSTNKYILNEIYLTDEGKNQKKNVEFADGKPISTNLSYVNYNKLALKVALVLSEHTGHKWLQQFADILGGYAQDYAKGNYIDRYYAGAVSGESCTIKVPAGYYMIIDQSSLKPQNDAYSARMLFVANDITQQVKASVPTLTKTILRDNETVGDAGHKTEAAGVGDKVKFQLKGTLPSNYENYVGGYKYSFIDTLSDGLTLDGSDNNYVKVYAQYVTEEKGTTTTDANTYVPVERNSFVNDKHTHSDGTEVTFAFADTFESATNKLTVTFPCLKDILINYNGSNYILTEKSVIYVEYTATVNEKALVKDGNTNEAIIKYSANPQSFVDTEETKPQNSTVYTYGFDLTKADSAVLLGEATLDPDTKTALANAKFVLLRATGTTNEYEIAYVPSSDTAPNYSINDWVTNKKITIDPDKDFTQQVKDFISKTDNNAPIGNTYTFSPDSDACQIKLKGLDEEVNYTLVEVEAPDDYALIDPITFILKGKQTDDVYNGEIDSVEKVKGFVSDNNDYNVSIENPAVLEDPIKNADGTYTKADDNGYMSLTVANFKYVDLPSTGGIGVYIYYIIGGALIAGAIVLFAVNRKKARKN